MPVYDLEKNISVPKKDLGERWEFCQLRTCYNKRNMDNPVSMRIYICNIKNNIIVVFMNNQCPQ